jgi:two-component system sensor histidine kinase PhcS
LKDIHQGMERIKNVISDLRAFAYPSRLSDQDSFKISDALTTALLLTSHELNDIEVDQSSIADAVALGAKTQIVHVLMNLLVNSAHALKEKPLGRPPKISIQCAGRQDRLEIAVMDNGAGVAPEHLPRLTEPFFTTKEPGKGTGLGLSICHTIVKNHGGEIAITSEKGAWTRVAFDLPSPEKKAA